MAKSDQSLSEWYKQKLSRPMLIVLAAILALQVFGLVYQHHEKKAQLDNSSASLANILSLAISQRNRPMIEMSAAFAMKNSGFHEICIFENKPFGS